MLMAQALPPDVYINPRKTRPLGAIAVPGAPGKPGIVFRGTDLVGPLPGFVPPSALTYQRGPHSPPRAFGAFEGSTGFYWGLALGALGMYGLMRFLG